MSTIEKEKNKIILDIHSLNVPLPISFPLLPFLDVVHIRTFIDQMSLCNEVVLSTQVHTFVVHERKQMFQLK